MQSGIKNTTVSVIIPVYNGEKYLRECLNSVLRQSYRNLEVIIINDGSTDHSWQIIEEYSARYNQIKGICQKNGGIASARNRGLDQASGDYIFFLDCDDILRERGIELLLERAKGDKADLVIGNVMYFYHHNRHLERPGRILKDGLYEGHEKLKLVHLNPFGVNKLWKRQVIQRRQLRFEPFTVGEDASFYLRFLTFAARISLVEECVSYYRLSDSSLVHTWSMKQLEPLEVYQRMEEFYRKQGGMEAYIQELAYDRLFFCCNTIRRLPLCKDKGMRRRLMEVLLKEGSSFTASLPDGREELKLLKDKLQWYQKYKGLYCSSLCSLCYKAARKLKHMRAKRNGTLGEQI